MTHWRAIPVKPSVPQRTVAAHRKTAVRIAHLCEVGCAGMLADTGAPSAGGGVNDSAFRAFEQEGLNLVPPCVPDGGQVPTKPANSFPNIEAYIIAMHGTDPRFQNGEPCF